MRLYSRLQIAIALTFAVTFAGVPSHVRSETRPLQISQAITQADLLFWQSIKDSKDPAMYRAYLKKFPKGVFAELAKLKVQKLSPGLPAPQKQVAQPSSKTNSEPKTAKDEKSGKMILVLDASGSMRAHLKGRSKMAVARDVFKDVVKDLDPSLYIGLTAYGHRRKDDCSDIEHLLPAQKLNPKSMISTVNRLKPIGKTPLTESVRQAAKNLKYTKQPATIILISDGRENCGADPCAVAKELKKAGAKFTVHVIGFDIKKEERRKLQCIADNTGGKYFAATDAGALKAALRASVAETKTAFEQGTAIFPTLGETDEYPRLAFQWKISKAVEGSDKAGNVVYTTKGSDRLINPKLPSGRYVVEISYANAKGRKVINYEAKSGKQYHIPLIAGRLTAWVIKKAGGDAYKGPPYPNWNISRAGSKKVAFSDINDRTKGREWLIYLIVEKIYRHYNRRGSSSR